MNCEINWGAFVSCQGFFFKKGCTTRGGIMLIPGWISEKHLFSCLESFVFFQSLVHSYWHIPNFFPLQRWRIFFGFDSNVPKCEWRCKSTVACERDPISTHVRLDAFPVKPLLAFQGGLSWIPWWTLLYIYYGPFCYIFVDKIWIVEQIVFI